MKSTRCGSRIASSTLFAAAWWLLLAVVVCQAQQQSFTTTRFRHELLLEGQPMVLSDMDARVIAVNMQLYLQGAVCTVEEQNLVEDDDEEDNAQEEDEEQYTLEIVYSCELPGGPALATQFLDFISRQDVTTALAARGLPVLEVSAPMAVETGQGGNVPTFSPVSAEQFEFAFFQQYFALHPGSTGFTPIQEMVISLEMQTLAVLNVLPTLNETGTMDVACVVPQNGQQVTVTTEQRVSIIQFQCSFASNTVNVARVPPALVEYVNANLPTVTRSLQQRGLAALVLAQPLQLVSAPTLAPSQMPVPTTAVPTRAAPTTDSPTISPTTLAPTTLSPTTLAPTSLTSVSGEFVQRFVVDERREGEVLEEGEEQESVVEVWEAFAQAANPDDAFATVTCAVTDQAMESSNVEGAADVLRMDYTCTFTSIGSSLDLDDSSTGDAPANFVSYMNDNLEDFTDELEGFLRIDEALVVRQAADATSAPSPGPPVASSMIGNYRQDFEVEGGSVIAAGRPAEAFASLVENLVEEFGEDTEGVTTECRIDDQALSETLVGTTTLTVEYTCEYSSFDTDVSSFPTDFVEYVNDDLEGFTELLQEDVDEDILAALVVQSAELMFATELPRTTLAPGFSPTSNPELNMTGTTSPVDAEPVNATTANPNATFTVDGASMPSIAPVASPPEAQVSSAPMISFSGLALLLMGLAYM